MFIIKAHCLHLKILLLDKNSKIYALNHCSLLLNSGVLFLRKIFEFLIRLFEHLAVWFTLDWAAGLIIFDSCIHLKIVFVV